MPTPLPTAAALPGSDAWHELEEVLAELGGLARGPIAPEQFYDHALAASVRALAAVGGTVWLRSPQGALRSAAQVNWPGMEISPDASARRAHEALVGHVAAEGRVITVGPLANHDDGALTNPSGYTLVLAPVRVAVNDTEAATDEAAATVAIFEIIPRADASPAVCRGYEQFLAAACEVSAEFHAYRELARLRRDESYHEQLVRLSTLVHRQIDLVPTAYSVANEGRRVVGCDRLSVLAATGGKCKLLATSGASRVERRSVAARSMEQLAELVRPIREPAYYADGQSDALPPIAESLEVHADESHARQIAVFPLVRPVDPTSEPLEGRSVATAEKPAFVLVAEQFDARHGDLSRERLVEVGHLCATALYNALEVEQLPFRWLLRPMAAAKRAITSHLARAALVTAAIAAAIAALVIVPGQFKVDAPGTLQPAVRQDVFAPRSGLVDEVLVAHGADVSAGQPLVRLRDPKLDLDQKRVHGEMETVRRQLDAVRATKTSRDIRGTSSTDVYRLSAEEREFEQRLANLERELDLLTHERDALVVRSPIAGRVLTWDPGGKLAARPVERGEVLLTVADLSADWQLEVEVPDDRIGYVLAAREGTQADLPVRFRLHSDDSAHRGQVKDLSMSANVAAKDHTQASPTVRVLVAFDKSQLSETALKELRPGVAARAEIDCGQKPLGYVWLHDVWDAAIGWLRF